MENIRQNKVECNRLNDVVSQMTIEEKVKFVSGTRFWNTYSIDRLGIPSLTLTDGPNGIRKQGENADHLGINQSEAAICFPTGATMASGWDKENLKTMGRAIAKEALRLGVDVVLGPSVNIKRNPLCGRNFEYLSEDPFLTGVLGSAFIEGVEEMGVASSVKHFAANNNEKYRFMGNSVVDERALREIYLRAFERMVKEAKPSTVMCAYNQINGVYCSENSYLLHRILREEWGFEGVVLSDWGAVNQRAESIRAGMDLEMPGDCVSFQKELEKAVQEDQLLAEKLDQSCKRILALNRKCKENIAKRTEQDQLQELTSVAIELATESAVLLKNDHVLPLDSKNQFLVIGEMFEKMRYQGAGSSMIHPSRLITPKDAFERRNISYRYYQGYQEAEDDLGKNKQLGEQALEASADYDMVLYFGGLTDYTESEGYDREHMRLPDNQIALIDQLIQAGKKIVFIMYGGSPVELPFLDKITALLLMYLPGQGGGEATASLLFGEKTPSGKLAETWPKAYTDVPFGDEFAKGKNELYKESIYVGYRYYDRAKIEVCFPFGYGLSYTQFAYSAMEVEIKEDDICVHCNIENIGTRFGAEVVQLYVKNGISGVFKAEKELRGFDKIKLEPGEMKKVSISFQKQDLAYYHSKEKKWVLENGEYTILLGASSEDLRLETPLLIKSETSVPPPYVKDDLSSYLEGGKLLQVTQREFERLIGRTLQYATDTSELHLNSPLTDYQTTFIGRILYKSIVGVGKKQYRKSLKIEDPLKRESEKKAAIFLIRMMPNNSLRSMAASSAGAFSMKTAKAFLEVAKGNLFKAILCFIKKE